MDPHPGTELISAACASRRMAFKTQSVCLFHETWGGSLEPHMFQNARPAVTHKKEWRPRRLPGGGMQEKPSVWTTLSPEDDPLDFELYEKAKHMFVQELKTFKYLQ